MNSKNYLPSYIKCGRVCDGNLPNNLDKSESPITLAKVNVDVSDIKYPTVLIKFSEFISFTLLGLNPKLNIIYRLIRTNLDLEDTQILEEWEFNFESLDVLEVANLITSQPTVLSYCDDLENIIGKRMMYEIQIVQIKSNNLRSLILNNESITATVISQINQCSKSKLPYISCGESFNPILPLNLKQNDKPLLLSQVEVYKEAKEDVCVLIDFSGFLTSVLREEDFNELTFRLIRSDRYTVNVLREWDFKRSFVNDTDIKEPIVYDYCECLSSIYNVSYIYRFELVCANLSDKSYYDIVNKSMRAQVYAEKEKSYLSSPYLNCGVVCNDYSSVDSKNNEIINLAFVKVDIDNTRNHILINYSQNLQFKFFDFNPTLSIDYRLIRKSNETGYIEELETWNYKVSEVIPTNVDEIDTVEPLVLNYCDYICNICDTSFTYILQITKAITENTSFNITDQEISAIVNR